MKYSITYKITAIFLVSLLVFSSLSFSVEKHFCEGEMRSSLFNKAHELCTMQATVCHSDETASNCCTSSVKSSECCIDSSEFIQGISIEVPTSIEQKISAQPVQILISTFFSTNFLFKDKIFSDVLFQPPILQSKDIGLLFQVFRI